MSTHYVEWLKTQGTPLYRLRDIYWQPYNRGLLPASPAPCFIEITHAEGKALLRESGAWFLEYNSDPCEQPTDWWYVVCDAYDPKKFPSKIRSEINRGNRNCSVKRVEAEWLAQHGYKCYLAAFRRHKNDRPVAQERFRGRVLRSVGGPFEYWGVFVGDKLAGYCQCVLEDKDVATSVIKLDPAYFKQYSSYALISNLVNHYVVTRGMVINNGTRSIAHETNFQQLLLKLGFRKQFCRLNVIYSGWMEKAVQVIFPFQKLIGRLPYHHGLIHKLRALLFLEELKRLCR